MLAKHSGFLKRKEKKTDAEEMMQEMQSYEDGATETISETDTPDDISEAADRILDETDDILKTSDSISEEADNLSGDADNLSEESDNIIDCDSLVKIYKTDEVEVMALQGLELTIKKGELMAVIGKSGSGKSTLLNMIGGLERPTAGKLYVDGKDLFAMTDRELEE